MSNQNPPEISAQPRVHAGSGRGTRRLLLWTSALCGVGFAVLLIGAILLQTQLIPAPIASDCRHGDLARERSGESTTAKNNVPLPRRSPTGGDGQSASEGAKEIYQGARPLELTADQRMKMKSWLAQHPTASRREQPHFSVSIGAAVPRDVAAEHMPAGLADILQGFRDDDYVMVGNQVVIIDPNARRVVAIVPGSN